MRLPRVYTEMQLLPASTIRIAVWLLMAVGLAGNVDLERVQEGRFSPDTSAGSRFLLVNWNIARGVQLEKITAYLQQAKADLYVLQEVDQNTRRTAGKNIAEELARLLRLNYAFGLAWEELTQGKAESPGVQGQATLARWDLERPRVIRFHDQSSFWQPKGYLPSWAIFQRRLGGRIALVTEMKFGSRRGAVYNLHLESRSGGTLQRLQLEEVLADAARYGADAPVIIAGDLNSKYFPRRYLERMKAAGYRSCFGENVVRTHVLVGWVDWIFLRGPIRCEEARVDRKATGSDHFPLLARIAVEP